MKFGKYLFPLGIVVVLSLSVFTLVVSRLVDKRLIKQKPEDQKTNDLFGQLTRIGGVGWEIGSIRLNISDVKIGDKNLLLVGNYIDDSGKEQKIQIFIGDLKDNGQIRVLSKIADRDGNQIIPPITNVDDLKKIIGKGIRAEIQFLINVPGYEKVIRETTFCADLPNFCELGGKTAPFQASYGGFWYKHEPLPAGMALNAIVVTIL